MSEAHRRRETSAVAGLRQQVQRLQSRVRLAILALDDADETLLRVGQATLTIEQLSEIHASLAHVRTRLEGEVMP
jgi:hypothetical protein